MGQASAKNETVTYVGKKILICGTVGQAAENNESETGVGRKS